MSAVNSRHSWTDKPILHFGNVETFKSATDEEVEYYENRIQELKERNNDDRD